ncbi:neuropeptide SIFamide receptor-like [Stylophora pistillata]|uniref:neuropeptide SIFamide receptor-like n=1 Tax=Stylophora pistillata TaxID=50429 RepID=UPI000C04DB2A|nr:neuropeptide SIFamide receptor-like [Stylophora pistillata]
MESFVKNISYPRYVASNITNPTCPTSESSVEMVAKASAYAIILVVSLVGNSILILSIAKNEQSRKSIHYLVLNMAVSDLLNSFTIMPIKLAQIISASGSWKVVRPWLLGNLLCKLSYFLIDVSLVVSIESLLLISVDRFIAVVFPLKAKLISSKVRLVGVLWTWIVATVVHAPYFYAYKLTPEGNETLCRLDWGPAFDHKKTHKRFVTATFIIFILVPIGVFAMVYGTIAWKLRRNNRKHKQQLGFRHKSRDEQHKKIVRMSVAIIVAFSVCSIPLLVYLFAQIFLWDWRLPPICAFRTVVPFLVAFMVHSWSAVNPCVCFIFSKYSKGLKQLPSFVSSQRTSANERRVRVETKIYTIGTRLTK